MLQLLQYILKIKKKHNNHLGYLNIFQSMVSKELAKLEHIYMIDMPLEWTQELSPVSTEDESP